MYETIKEPVIQVYGDLKWFNFDQNNSGGYYIEKMRLAPMSTFKHQMQRQQYEKQNISLKKSLGIVIAAESVGAIMWMTMMEAKFP